MLNTEGECLGQCAHQTVSDIFNIIVIIIKTNFKTHCGFMLASGCTAPSVVPGNVLLCILCCNLQYMEYGKTRNSKHINLLTILTTFCSGEVFLASSFNDGPHWNTAIENRPWTDHLAVSRAFLR